jgi:GTP cyclohydrolase I
MRDDSSGVAAITEAVHLCADMQNIFAPGGVWATR